MSRGRFRGAVARWWAPAGRWSRAAARHRYGLTLVAYLVAAMATGGACVLFMRAFEAVLARRLDPSRIGPWGWLLTPVLFTVAVVLIRRVAPPAAGTGIPQTVFASEHLTPRNESRLAGLLSPRTVAVKVGSLLVGVAGGASTGREGPTVHIAAGVFLGVLRLFNRIVPIRYEARSAVVAGGAAGLAAAFNTPLAGVTFAVEELTPNYFAGIKDYVLMAIVAAALAAKALTGEYGYFGRLEDPADPGLGLVLLIGVAGGLLGAGFSAALLRGSEWFGDPRRGAWRLLVPAAFGLMLLGLAAVTPADVLGPGNAVAASLLHGDAGTWVDSFPYAKIVATLLTYWSGLAGGIFAPCLAVGAGLGAQLAHGMGGPVAGSALVGMAAFLAGTIQAPVTSFVIIFEMTGHHAMLLPVMLGALSAFMTARLIGADHFYQALAARYRSLLRPAPPSPAHP